jgi:hypothetical protein
MEPNAPRCHKCNQGAISFQAKPNKSKQNRLDLFGFIRPNRDFSKGSERKIKKSARVSSCVQNVSSACLATFTASLPWRRLDSGEWEIMEDHIPHNSDFRKQILLPTAIARASASCGFGPGAG